MSVFMASNGLAVERFPDCIVFTSDLAQTTREISPSEMKALREMLVEEAEKPWLAARLGDVWVLTYGGEPTAHVFTDLMNESVEPTFVSDHAVLEIDDPEITSGRRIWPADEEAV